MNIIGDLHCHTIASVHAYNTIFEMIGHAKAIGLKVVAITDHGIAVPVSAPIEYFNNLIALPRMYQGVVVLRGCEANIMDYDGRLDMPEETMDQLDLVIASMHNACIQPGTKEDHTRAYLAVAQNPYVDIIGHAGTSCYPFDYEAVIPVMQQQGKVFEINTHTFICRPDSLKNCRRIASICKECGCPILINSDAHVITEMGIYAEALQMLQEIHFPEELILNGSSENMNHYLEKLGIDVRI